jgi:hypothetical protein
METNDINTASQSTPHLLELEVHHAHFNLDCCYWLPRFRTTANYSKKLESLVTSDGTPGIVLPNFGYHRNTIWTFSSRNIFCGRTVCMLGVSREPQVEISHFHQPSPHPARIHQFEYYLCVQA